MFRGIDILKRPAGGPWYALWPKFATKVQPELTAGLDDRKSAMRSHFESNHFPSDRVIADLDALK